MGFSDCMILYQKYGNKDYLIDESITQIQHALQAAHIAKICQAPDYIVIGLLLHDIGQLVGLDREFNINSLHTFHDTLGAKWLKQEGFQREIINIAKYHTLYKVLLCNQDKKYFSTLSKASQQSYFIQKEKYSNFIETTKFCPDKFHTPEMQKILIACRLIDDMAKIPKFNPEYFDFEADNDTPNEEKLLISKINLNKLESYESLYNKVKTNSLSVDYNDDYWITKVKELFELQINNYPKFIAKILNK